MEHNRNQKPHPDDYHFMSETIKKRPFDMLRMRRAFFTAAGCGLIFGICAVAVMGFLLPPVLKNAVDEIPGWTETEITLSPESVEERNESTKESLRAIAQDGENTSGTSENPVEVRSPVEIYEELYQDIFQIAEKPRKAIVKVFGISGDHDLLDNSIMDFGEENGIIFLNNDSDLYILTTGESLTDVEHAQVVFADGTLADGEFCGIQEEIGLAVIRVSMEKVSAETLDAIEVLSISDAYEPSLAQPVVAVGSPTGDTEGVICGMLNSVKGTISVADAQLRVLATDMRGDQDGNGILVDAQGQAVGIILNFKDRENNVIRALSIAQLRPLVEALCNEIPLRYLGIVGMDISDVKAKALEVPQGIYVDRVDDDSPSMRAGIQSGDILQSLDGSRIKDMQAYTEKLQSLKKGDRAVIVLCRRSGSGEYEEMSLEVIVEEK